MLQYTTEAALLSSSYIGWPGFFYVQCEQKDYDLGAIHQCMGLGTGETYSALIKTVT